MPCAPNPKFEKAVSDFTKILIENELIVEDFLFKEKKCKCIRVYYKRKIFYTIKTCDFTTADVLEDHQNWLNYLDCIRKELCCFIREKTVCLPICIKQTLLKSFQTTEGEITYVMQVDVKNESDKKIKNLVVRDVLLKKDMCVGLIEVLVDHGCSIKPVDENTPDYYVGNGYLLDPRFSCLEPKSEISIIYSVQLIDQTVTVHNMTSRVEVYGRLVCRVESKLILEPISRAGNMVPASLGSRNLLNYLVPPNCILVTPISFGVNGAQITKIINGISYTIKLTNWVKKAGTTNRYIKVNYELLPGDKGVVNKISALSLFSLYNTYPNNTSGTLTMPLNTVLCGTVTFQTTFLAILFCITPCAVPTVSLTLTPLNPVVAAGALIPVATTVTGFPTPSVSYSLDNTPFSLTINSEVDTANLAPGVHTLVATAINSCGSTSSTPVTFEICAPPTIILNSISPTLLARDVSPPFPYLTVDFVASGSPAPSLSYTVRDLSNNIAKSGPLVDDDLNTLGWQINMNGLSDGTYTVELVATNACGSTVSGTKQFTIVTDTTAPVQPIIVSVSGNVNGSFICSLPAYEVIITAEPFSTVRLYENNGIQIGATTADSNGNATINIDATVVELQQNVVLTATATDSAGNSSAPSNPFNFTITNAPNAGSIGSITVVTTPTTNSFGYTITLSGINMPPSPYTLEYIIDNSVSGDITSGTASGIFSSANSGTYNVVIRASNICASNVNVGSANFPVCLLPFINVQPVSQTVEAGTSSSVSFTVDASVSNGIPLYQWYKNNVLIPGATASTLTLTNVPYTDNGSLYFVRVTNGCGSFVDSDIVTLTVQDTTAPSPFTLSGQRTGFLLNNIQLNWTQSTDNVAVTNYTVRRSDNVTYNNGLSTTRTINGVTTQYTYFVRATDAAGNVRDSNSIFI